MATTVKALVLKHHEKADGSFNVKIRITHEGVSRYIETGFHVSRKQLDERFRIKPKTMLVELDKTVSTYRQKIGELNRKLTIMQCDDIVEYLKSSETDINFVAFARSYIEELIKTGKDGSIRSYKWVVRGLIDFFKREVIYITEINAQMLNAYEKFLRTPREIKRTHRNKKEFIIGSKGLSDSGVHNHMRDLRLLFNVARSRFNDDDFDIIRIRHYPFKKYKIPHRPETRKRNLSVEQILQIRDCKLTPGDRTELARDLFMLSFYLCGTNAADFYQISKQQINNGRIEFNRSKTKWKRKDKAFISFKITPEAEPLVEKYIGTFKERFSTKEGFNTALANGMRHLRSIVEIDDITFYWARHSFATIARNVCRKSMDDVALALNHIDSERRTTDIYIAKDWTIVDEVQEAVTKLLK